MHARFRLQATVRYTWKVPGSDRQVGEGQIRDVSSCGLFVLTDSCPAKGSSVRVNILFSTSDGSARLSMQARATVLRVEANHHSLSGFAAVTKKFAIRNAAPIMNHQDRQSLFVST